MNHEEIPLVESKSSISTSREATVPLLQNTSRSNPKIVINNDTPTPPKHPSNIDHKNGCDQSRDKLLHPPPLYFQEGNKTLTSHEQGEIEINNDLSAMSVLSLYNNSNSLDSEMDTTKDLEEVPPKTIRIAVNEINELDAKENIDSTFTNNCCHDSSQKYHNISSRKHNAFECSKPTIFFKDGKRCVDFVLVWDSSKAEAVGYESQNRRKMFEDNLEREGLELEYEPMENNGLQFLKIHAPNDVLRRYGEILKLRMPMKEELCRPKGTRQNRFYRILANKLLGREMQQPRSNFFIEGFNSQWKKIKTSVFVDVDKFPEKGQRFTAIYSRDREYLFDVNAPCFFTPAIHSRIVQFILDRKRFSEDPEDDFAFGIERLLNDKVYIAAYPLHDGNKNNPGTMRNLLYDEWACFKRWYRYQPLDYVKEYFGVKIALYFAWLGFYTQMLIPAAAVGLLCFIYSCFTIYNYKPSQDVCNPALNITMCPQCDHFCQYWDLSAACLQARATYLFDNPSTIFFTVFMSIWATIFLEFWKRSSAEITHRWDLTGFDVKEEHPRPQYLARLSHVTRKHVNIITNTMEPHVPFWKMRVPATVFSFSVVLLLVAMAFATVAGVVLYRMSLLTALRVYGKNKDNSSYVMFFTSITAASINLCCIVIFNWLYSNVAHYLTELEFIRTQTQFDDSLTLKIYLLQFVNYYASIFYIAFFKGKFVGHPKQYNKFFGYRQEECGLGGCLMELCIQLSIIMVGKQALNSVIEMLQPIFYRWLNTLKVKAGLEKDQYCIKTKPQWVRDFKLVEWGPRSLFPEYLEMVLQYGFVTIFVAAFPLAPFFALLNNILEMRLDARKLLLFYRRPVTQRVQNIGVWYNILDSISKLSVVTNGLIIAFTSDFIPRLVYRIYISDNYTLDGYVNRTLSVFNTSDFEFRRSPNVSSEANLEPYSKVPICRYLDYRNPPRTSKEYQLSSLFWHILAARLAFVVIFENVVAFVIILVKWLIPDIPGDLRDQIRRETYITNEIIIQQEAFRAKAICTTRDQTSPPIIRRVTLGVGACPTTSEDWDQIIENDVDLMKHSKTFPDKSSQTNDDDTHSPTISV